MGDLAREYYELFTDVWKYFRRYAGQIPLSDQAWEKAVQELTDILDRHTDCQRLARKLLIAAEDELEHLDRAAAT